MGERSEAGRTGADAVLFGGGEMGAAMRALDWAHTPVGPVDRWPQSLKTVVRLMLDSRYAMWLGWGPQLTFFCNDAYRPTLGAKRGFLGAPTSQVWAEIWPEVGPRVEQVFGTGEATWDQGLQLFLQRSGFKEETYHSFSYSPVYGEGGAVEGLLCVVTEESERVVGARRLAALGALASATLPARSAEQACELAAHALAEDDNDLPFVLVYLLDDGARRARLCAYTGVARGSAAAPEQIALDDASAGPWPLALLHSGGEPLVLDDVAARVGKLVAGPWPEPIERATVLPLTRAGSDERLAGFLVVGVSPRLPFDDAYRRFLQLAAGQVATAISDARAFEEEKRRAEALAEIDRAKTTFFSNVSHELRTPLTLMLGPIADLLAGPAGAAPESAELLTLAQRNGQRLRRLVNSLLDFSRIEAGRLQTRYEPVDLAAFTVELASVFRSAMEKAGLQFVVDCPPLPEPVFVDRGQWEKIVLNLLSNALKYTFEGTVRVELKADGDAALLVVCDTGIGVPATALPRLFERFYRVEGARGRTIEGSGIGLALVQELTRLHGGSVAADSREGEGSCFRVRIPFGHAHLSAESVAEAGPQRAAFSASDWLDEAGDWLRETGLAAPAPPPGSGAAAHGDGGDRVASRPLVLVADDNADMRGYLQRLLEPDHDVITCGDGEAALQLVREREPDLLLTDVMMPKLDGFALLRALRADRLSARTPVILLSARAGDEARIEGLQAGADDYLTKPFNTRELLARVAGTLALAKARRETETVLDSLTEGFVAVDAQWRYTYVNAAAERMLRTSRDTLFGVSLWEAFPGTLGSAFEAPFRRAMLERVPQRVDAPYEPLDLWLEASVNPVADGGLAFYFRDIHKGKLLERSVREADARQRFLLELSAATQPLGDPAAIAALTVRMLREHLGADRCTYGTVQPDGEHLVVSAESSAGVTGTPSTYRLADLGAGLLAAFRDGQPWVIDDSEADTRVADERATYRAAGVRAHLGMPLRDEAGQLVAALAVQQQTPRRWSADDIDLVRAVAARCREAIERAGAQQALRDSEAQLRVMADAMPQIVYVTDVDGTLEFVNQQWRDYTGQDEPQRVYLPSVVHPDDLAALIARWEEAKRKGAPFTAEFRLRRASDGAYRWFLTRATPQRDGSGKIVRWYGTSTDIDRQKRDAEALRLAHAALQVADRRKDEFLATLAHELRNPLAPLRNSVHILQLAKSAESAGKVHQMMQRQIDHMVRLVDDLMEVSRITSGNIELQRAPVALATVLASAVETSRPLIDAHRHRLELDIDAADALMLDADAVRLSQVFANLLNNAAKYTEAGGRITLSARRAGSDAQVTVRDTGIGIAPEMLPRIFELFAQVDRSAAREQGGLGIGLSLVRSLLAMHGGSVEARSEGIGRGSEFVVRLPLADVASAASSQMPRPLGAALPRAARVLVVDDNHDAADSLGSLLQFLGAEVEVAHDGPGALVAFDTHRPAVVLLDIGMPGMDGHEVARRIRAAGHDTMLVALTGWGQKQDRERSREAGFDHHLVKPVDVDALQALLASARA
jgi:PAS domain S-box-containing protein